MAVVFRPTVLSVLSSKVSSRPFIQVNGLSHFCCANSLLHSNQSVYRRQSSMLVSQTQNPGFLKPQSMAGSLLHPVRSFSLDYYYSVHFPPVGFLANVLTSVHDLTGLPWWASIIASALALRLTVSLPFAIISETAVARLHNLTPEIQSKGYRLRKEVDQAQKLYNWSEQKKTLMFKKNMKRLTTEMYVRENCHPSKVLTSILVQIPLWIATTVALRNLCGRGISSGSYTTPPLRPDMAEEGVLWFPDLLVPDALYLLPVLTSSLFITNILVAHRKGPANTGAKLLKRFSIGYSLLFLPLGYFMPSGVFLYWVTSAAYSLVQYRLLRIPKVQRLLRIPQLIPHSKNAK